MTRHPHKEPEMTFHELDHRSSNGIDVYLLWNARSDALTVYVIDAPAGDSFALDVAHADALDAFHHPYAYAASRGIGYAAGARAPVYA